MQTRPIRIDYSVPQGSVLEPLKFISYTEDVVEVFTRNLVRHRLFADDKQLYRSGKITKIDNIRHHLCHCINGSSRLVCVTSAAAERTQNRASVARQSCQSTQVVIY